jgi:hypothetical protein
MAKHDDAAQDRPLIKKIADQEVKKHEKRMHGKGMAKGGVTGEAMRKYGRNVARAMNQKSTGRGR